MWVLQNLIPKTTKTKNDKKGTHLKLKNGIQFLTMNVGEKIEVKSVEVSITIIIITKDLGLIQGFA